MDYSILVGAYDKLERTSKRLEKTYILSELLRKVKKDNLKEVVYLLQGRVFPILDERKLGMSSMLIIKALIAISGDSKDKIERLWKREGDLGKVAEILVKEGKQRTLHYEKLTTKKVFVNLRKLAELEGKGTVNRKIQLVAELLGNAKPIEAKFVVKTVLNELRVGVAAGTIRDAIVWAFFYKEIGFTYNKEENNFEVEDRSLYNRYVDAVQRTFDVTNDFGETALIAKKGLKSLEKIELEAGKPINVMLFQKAEDIEDAFSIVGKPAAIEFKYDGFRLQLHRKDGEIKLYSRRLEDVTKQFPEVVNYVKKYLKGKNFILDAEAVGYDAKTKKYLPFQAISQRIKRKYHIEELAKKYPVEVNIFDVMFYNNRSLINEPFKKRRDILKKILLKKQLLKIVLAKQLVTSDRKDAEKFYNESLKKGEEGIMVKNLEGVYKPGSRVGYGVKVKPILEPLDLVIIAADFGEGKRSKWLSSFTVACWKKDKLVEIGKVSTGLKEKKEEGVTFEEMTKILKPLIIKEKGKHVIVKPEIVMEVGYEEIQKSPTYSSGYALRFPKILRLRVDEKKPKDANTLREVENIYNKQRK